MPGCIIFEAVGSGGGNGDVPLGEILFESGGGGEIEFP